MHSDPEPVSRRSLLVAGAMGAACPALLLPGYAGSARADAAFAVSTGKADITPRTGAYLAGYGNAGSGTSRHTSTVSSPLWARCIVIWDNGYPNVVVTADVLAFARETNLAIRQAISSLGIAGSDFVLTATHTHNGPVLVGKLDPYIAYNIKPSMMGPVKAYTDWLAQTIVELVRQTIASTRTPCTLEYHVANANFSINREGLPYVERDVPVLVARSADGHPRAVLFGYGCHPVSAGALDAFDPDYPGVAVSHIEQTTGAFAQFILGAAGDQNPAATGAEAKRAHGQALGRTVVTAIHGGGAHPITGPILTAYQDVTLPLNVTDTPANLSQVRALYQQRLTHPKHWYRRHAELMTKQIDTHTFVKSIPLPLQVWKFGGSSSLRMAFVGGELVSGYAVYFRNRHPASQVWVSGYSNEVPAYIPSDELLTNGGAWQYACGWEDPHRGIAGGAMTVYGQLGHFLGRRPGTTTNGVEQILIAGLDHMLTG